MFWKIIKNFYHYLIFKKILMNFKIFSKQIKKINLFEIIINYNYW